MEAFKQLEALIAAKISIIRTVLSVFRLEARLAGLSVFPLLLNICMLLVIFITVWLTAMFLLGYFVALTSNSLFLALVLILLLNIGLLLGLTKYLSYNLSNMSFQKTREYFSQQSAEHEKLKKTDHCTNCSDG
ncbi:hypothetical protein [Legionella cincinnatiensis]|uniref:Transmembrane protein n=1 Tax=Legionella cincinnatiensis TaxID=28085 RepID=A0A378IHH3_9GAMM|nr:hypothetical protein [Legionella cincinnatiensis]KTC83594.1 hypothetical protein Lcin_2281 [Legionella cincinnatiensis]STX34446.1 Uncharacterised protein [Legionella cincinnatiensis]